jgi:transcription elongation factor GreA
MGDAAGLFLTHLPEPEREAAQPEVFKFAHWYGQERLFNTLMPPEVAGYAERISTSDTDYSRKLDLLRAFLAYAKKRGWTSNNLATHLKAKKGKEKAKSTSSKKLPESFSLTREKYEELEAELASLREKSLELIDDIRLAAADKDFRENAPLAAAREQRSHVEGRIREIEETLKFANIIDNKQATSLKTCIGDTVVIIDSASGEELRYIIVDPREVDPLKGKISTASPLGKALLGRCNGDSIEISVRAGKLCYEIKGIER